MSGFPGVEEGVSYGTPGWKVRKKFLARLHQDEPALVLRFDLMARDALMEADPKTFYITDHYANHPAVLIHMDRAKAAMLRDLVEETWRTLASKKQLAEFDEA